MSWRRFCKMSWRRFEDVLKVSWRRMARTNTLVLTKTSSRCLHQDEYLVDYYYYFFKKIFWFQSIVCHGCHDEMQKAVNFNYVDIITVKCNDYKIFFLYMSKDEAINLLRNPDFTGKSGSLQNIKFYYHIKILGQKLKLNNITFIAIKLLFL